MKTRLFQDGVLIPEIKQPAEFMMIRNTPKEHLLRMWKSGKEFQNDPRNRFYFLKIKGIETDTKT